MWLLVYNKRKQVVKKQDNRRELPLTISIQLDNIKIKNVVYLVDGVFSAARRIVIGLAIVITAKKYL